MTLRTLDHADSRTAAATMPDLFFLLCQETKRYLREHGKPVDELFAAAVRESAWSSVRNVMELSMIVPVGQNEALRAMTYRDLHDDFEDDLLLAAAARTRRSARMSAGSRQATGAWRSSARSDVTT